MKVSLFSLVWVACATLLGLFFGFTSLGLTSLTAGTALTVGSLIAGLATFSPRHLPRLSSFSSSPAHICIAIIFLLFAIRAFSRVIFIQDGAVKVLSPNNLGDICLHLTHINYLAHSPRFWPPNPIYAFDQLRYPIGLNLFNAELRLVGVEPKIGIIICALLGSLLALRALFLFNGPFGVAAFLFNGGLAGFALFQSWRLQDYQADLAWKSIPLALFVTQRGLLYAIPAGLLLLVHWRRLLFERSEKSTLPFWAEWLLYTSLPLFHLHTFLFLSLLLLWWFVFGNPNWRGHLLCLVGLSVVPASLLVYFVTGFSKSGAIAWQPGWLKPPDQSAWSFWLINFGLFLPLVVALLVYLCFPARPMDPVSKQNLRLFVVPSVLVFVACAFVRFAPWAWDNTKLLLWAYLVLMFCLWQGFFIRWPWWTRVPVFLLLFFSGAVSLLGGLLPIHTKEGYAIGDAQEWRNVEQAIAGFGPEKVFAVYPTYNHPVLVAGHRVVLGFPGHLWSHGLVYRPYEIQLTRLMRGDPHWPEICRALKVDYIFWGRFEQAHYPVSTRPWEQTCPVIASGSWGQVFDVGSAISRKPMANPERAAETNP
jgi:hypothetical protein